MKLRLTSLLIASLAAGMVWSVAAPAGATDGEPVPIPGGLPAPDGSILHVFVPGPTDVILPFSGTPLMGENIEPNTITNFRGETAQAYVLGTATDADGNQYNLEFDVRGFQGTYVAADGTVHFGTFAFI